MEAKEILEKYKNSIVIHKQVDSRRAVGPLESTRTEERSNPPRMSDDMSKVAVCNAININPKELTVRQQETLDYIISEVRRLSPENPEQVILRLLSRIGEPPVGSDLVTHLGTYLKLRSEADRIGQTIL